MLINNIILGSIAQLLEKGSPIVASMLLSSYLSKEDFAAYSIFYITIITLAAYCSLGVGVASVKLAAEYYSGVTSAKDELNFLFGLTIIAGLVGVIAMMPLYEETYSLGVDQARLFFVVGVAFVVFNVVPANAMNGLGKYKEMAVGSIGAAAIILFGAWSVKHLGNVIYAVLALLVMLVYQFFWNYRCLFKEKIILRPKFSRRGYKKLSSLVGPLILVSAISGSSTWVVSQMLIKQDGSGDLFPVYVVGLQWISLVLYFPGVLTKIFFPRMVERKGVDNNFNFYSTVAITVSAALVAFFAIIACDYSMLFYGEVISKNSHILKAYLIAAVPMAPANNMGNMLVAGGYQLGWLIITLIWFFLYVGGVYFIDEKNEFSVALSYGGSAMVMTCMSFVVAKYRKII